MLRTLLAMAAALALPPFASAHDPLHDPLIPFRTEKYTVDSGPVTPTARGVGREVVYRHYVVAKDAQWLRLYFDEVLLAGDPGTGAESLLRITSLRDGAVQVLNSEHLRQWSLSSAYFNGAALIVDVLSVPGAGPSRIKFSAIEMGDPPGHPETICDGADLRVLSNDPKTARLMTVGCTAWLINDVNNQFLTAGHCGPGASTVVQFNVPLSNSNGSVNHPGPEDQYPVEFSSVQRQNGGVGQDWSYFGVFPNSTTGMMPYQKQGQVFILAAAAPPVTNQTIRITGYGTTSSPVPPTWNQAQKTHVGPYFSRTGTTIRYRTDTTGGNSGSAVFMEDIGMAIGIHTHGGCTSSGGSNQGTAIHHTGLQNALANPRGICASGLRNVSPPVYAAGDLNNNFGTTNISNGEFGKIAQPGIRMQGLAFDPASGNFFMIDNLRELWVLTPAGNATLVGHVQAATSHVIHGLAYDPFSAKLYGISQSDGQLFQILIAGPSAVPIGSPSGGGIGGMDFDTGRGVLFGLRKDGTNSLLVQISASTGATTVVGGLGISGIECTGLAYNDRDGMLYTIDSIAENLLMINPTSGAATVVGPTLGMFAARYGMATELLPATLVAPVSFDLTRGVLNSGGLAELLNSDDSRMVVSPGLVLSSVEDPVSLVLDAISPSANPTSLRFRLEAHATSPNIAQKIDLYDFTAASWVQLESRPSTLSDSISVVELTSDPSRFVQDGTNLVRARIRYRQAGPVASFPWQARIDQVAWVVGQ